MRYRSFTFTVSLNILLINIYINLNIYIFLFRTRIIKKIEFIILLLFHNENVILTMAEQTFLEKLNQVSEKDNNETSRLVNALLHYKDIKVIYNEDTGIYSIFTYKDYLLLFL